MSPESSPAPIGSNSGRTTAAALFAGVLGARLWLVRSAGSPVPYWDQWDAEALGLYRPWLTGTLDWAGLFAPHNEHRIGLTRLADLLLFSAAGAWNPWTQLILNALLHAACAVGLLLAVRSANELAARPLAAIPLAVLFAVPAGWQNALWGFQSQVCFGDLLTVLALAGLAGAPLRSFRWWAGWCCALLALFTNAGGLLTATAALPAVALAKDRGTNWRAVLAPLLAVAAVVAAGAALHTNVPAHAALRAADAAQFLAVLLRSLAWPWVETPWAAFLMQAPALCLLGKRIRDRSLPDATDRVLLALVLWAALHAAVTAWSRGAGLPDGRPLSRYQDPLVLGTAAQLLILLRLAAAGRSARIAALLWSGCLLAGLLTLTTHVLTVNLPFKRRQDAVGLAQIRAYLDTRDPATLSQGAGPAPLHPDPAVVRRVLDDPVLASTLPRAFSDPSARPPLFVILGPWLLIPALVGLLLAARPRRAAG